MWIDYQKAYDSVPHSWVTEILEIYKIDVVTRGFIAALIPLWRTRIRLQHKNGVIETEEIFFLQGIFQGDSLSPLIFCLALVPLSSCLQRAGVGYVIRRHRVSHLLYMDDLKVYAKD